MCSLFIECRRAGPVNLVVGRLTPMKYDPEIRHLVVVPALLVAVFFADCFVLVYLARTFGLLVTATYLMLAIGVGFWLSVAIARVRHRLYAGIKAPVSDEAMSDYIAFIVAFFLCWIPGFVSNVVALLVVTPAVRADLADHLLEGLLASERQGTRRPERRSRRAAHRRRSPD